MTAPYPCMGGMCQRRNTCPHYTTRDRKSEPVERMCEPGRDGVMRPAPKFVPDAALQSAKWARDFVSMTGRASA